jgi:hypothetical protein
MKRAAWLAQSVGIFLAIGLPGVGVSALSVAADCGAEPKRVSGTSRNPDDKSIRITLFCPSDTVVKINHATMLASGTRREYRSRVEDSNHHKYFVEVSRRDTTTNATGGGAVWPTREVELPLKAGETYELFYKIDGLHRLKFPTLVPSNSPTSAQPVKAPLATSASRDSDPECVGAPQCTAICSPSESRNSTKAATPPVPSASAEKDPVERLRSGTLPTLTKFSPEELSAEVGYGADGNLSSFDFCKNAKGEAPPETLMIRDKNSWPKAFAPSDAKLAIVVRAYLKCGETHECEYTQNTYESTAGRSPSSNGAAPENSGSPFKLAFDGSWQNRVASMEASQLNRNVLNALKTLTPQINNLNPVTRIDIFGYMQYSTTILKDIRLLDNRITVTVCEKKQSPDPMPTPPPAAVPAQ